MSKNAKVLEIAKDRIIEKLEKALKDGGSAPWQKPWKGSRNYVTGHQYRGINIFTLPEDESLFLTYNQFKKLKETKKYADISIKKGAKKYPILYWKWFDKQVEEKNEKTGEVEKTTVKYPRVFYYSVFKASDIENLPEKKFDGEVYNVDEVDNFINSLGFDIRVVKGSYRAYYNFMQDFIVLPDKSQFTEQPNSWYSVAFHEIGHNTGHKDRLNRSLSGNFGSKNYGKEELVAECFASMMTGYFSVQSEWTEKNQIAYLKSWINAIKEDATIITSASQLAQAAADYTLALGGLVDVEETQKAS